MKLQKFAFTLVEVMIVVALIALLSAIAIPNLLRSRITANESAAQVALKAISTALETYASSNNVYPSNTTALMGSAPPYLNVNYFSGQHNGYTFTSTLSDYTYSIVAVPVSSTHGIASYTITTAGVLITN